MRLILLTTLASCIGSRDPILPDALTPDADDRPICVDEHDSALRCVVVGEDLVCPGCRLDPSSVGWKCVGLEAMSPVPTTVFYCSSIQACLSTAIVGEECPPDPFRPH